MLPVSAFCVLATLAFTQPQPPAALTPPAPPRIALIPLEGELATEIAPQPVREILQAVQAQRPDVVIFKISITGPRGYVFADPKLAVPWTDSFLDPADSIGELHSLLNPGRDVPLTFPSSTRCVSWIVDATGWASTLPFIFNQSVWAENARCAALCSNTDNGGHHRSVRRFAIREAATKTLMKAAHHEPRIFEAMVWPYYTLSVSFKDGKAVYFDDDSGDLLLTDHDRPGSGPFKDPANHRAVAQNTYLTLTPDLALKLGLSVGTASTLPEVLAALKLPADSVILPDVTAPILARWKADRLNAIKKVAALWNVARKSLAPGPKLPETPESQKAFLVPIIEIDALLKSYAGAILRSELPADFFDEPTDTSTAIELLNNKLQPAK